MFCKNVPYFKLWQTGSKLTLPIFLDGKSVYMTVAYRTFAHLTTLHLDFCPQSGLQESWGANVRWAKVWWATVM